MKRLIRSMVLLAVCAVGARAACTVGDFDYCYELTIPATPVANHVVHFFTDYAGISGNMASFRTAIASAAGKVRSDGYDIQFFDSGGTIFADQGRVYYDNSDGDGWWVIRVPTVSTTTIQVRIGKSDATDVSDFTSSGVFQDFDYVLLNGAATDWSGNSRYGSFTGGLSTAAGKAGLGFDLNSADPDYVTSTGLSAVTDTTQAMTILFKNDNQIGGTGSGERILSWESGTGAYINIRGTWGTSTPLGQTQYQAGTNDYSNWKDGTIAAGTWNYLTTAVAATTSSHSWVNGAQTDTDTPDNALANRTRELIIGAQYNGSNPFDGVVNLLYLVLGGTATTYPHTGSLVEHDYDYDTFFTPASVFTMSTETAAPVAAMNILIHSTVVYGSSPAWLVAPASSASACDQVNAALGWDPGQSTPTGNQFVICSPEGERMRTGFSAQ